MRALVAILRGLPLQPTTDMSDALSEKINPAVSENETGVDFANETKGKMFYKYMTFFLKVIQTCKVIVDCDF